MNDYLMTIEEAIELLSEKRMEINYKVNGTTQFSEALNMAIKALRVMQGIQDAAMKEILKTPLERGVKISERTDNNLRLHGDARNSES